jgi:hypothetical protein
MAFKRVKVTLHHIRNESTGSDPGDELEIYGRFDVARLRFDPDIGEVLSLDGQNLFFRADDNTVDIPQGQEFPVNGSAELTISDGEFLQISGHLTEQDTFGEDDRMETMDFRFGLNEITNKVVTDPDGQEILFHEDDQRVRVKMSMVVLGQG